MLAGKPVMGYSVGLGSPLVAELLAYSGADFLLIETQHGSWGGETSTLALAAMAAGPAIPMARVGKNDYYWIGRMMDQGLMGIVIPMVDTLEQAKEASSYCHLPPKGIRSWGVGRARTLGDDYFDKIEEELFVAVQIESITAVENAEAIMAVDGIDGCWIGPADLALSMGIDPRQTGKDDRHENALQKVLQACRNTGKIPGLSCSSAAEAKRRSEQGFQFLTAGNDANLLGGAAKAGVALFHK